MLRSSLDVRPTDLVQLRFWENQNLGVLKRSGQPEGPRPSCRDKDTVSPCGHHMVDHTTRRRDFHHNQNKILGVLDPLWEPTSEQREDTHLSFMD